MFQIGNTGPDGDIKAADMNTGKGKYNLMERVYNIIYEHYIICKFTFAFICWFYNLNIQQGNSF